MTQAEQRGIAISAARGYLRSIHIDPATVTGREALSSLSDLCMKNDGLVVCKWYLSASENQLNLFEREWRRRQKAAVRY